MSNARFIKKAEYDSADELDGYASDDAPRSQKIPSSNVHQNNELFNAMHAASHIPSNYYPPGDNHNYSQSHPINQQDRRPVSAYSHIHPENAEAIKKFIYGKSPKELANDYLHSSRQQQHIHSHHKSKHSHSPPHQRNLPYTFNHDKENKKIAQEDHFNIHTHVMNKPEPVKASAYTEISNKLFMDRILSPESMRKTDVAVTKKVELLLDQNSAHKIEEKRTKASKLDQAENVRRLVEQGRIVGEHAKALAEDYYEKEMKECTFAPNIGKNAAPHKRTPQEFIEEQKERQKHSEEYKKKLVEVAKLEEEKNLGTFKPSICPGSAKILEHKKEKEMEMPVHHRLYKVGKNAHAKHLQDIAEKEEGNIGTSHQSSQFIGNIASANRSEIGKQDKDITFQPKINKKSMMIKRDEKIEDKLYQDAMRRKNKSTEGSQHQLRESSASVAQMSNKSRRALATRFIKEFDLAIVDFVDEYKPQKLDYIQLNEFLKRLSFLKDSESVESPHFTPERLLLYDMWYILEADHRSGIHRRNLLVFLLAVLGLQFQITRIQPGEEDGRGEFDYEMPNSKSSTKVANPSLPEGVSHRERRHVGSFDEDGNYELSDAEVKKIHQIFELWHLNRIVSTDNIGQLISSRKVEDPTFHPEINESSRNIAQNYREKILQGTAELIQQNKVNAPKDGKITHVDLLIMSKKVVQDKLEKKGEKLKEEEVKDCTFKPQTIEYEGPGEMNMESIDNPNRKANVMPPRPMGPDRALELYNLGKNKQHKKDRDKLELEYEKHCDECTFQPNISSTRDSKVFMKAPTEFYARGIDKNVDRLRSARIDKEQNSKVFERGFPTGSEGKFVFSMEKDKFKAEASIDKLKKKDHNSSLAGKGASNQNSRGHASHNKSSNQREEEDHYENQGGYNPYAYEFKAPSHPNDSKNSLKNSSKHEPEQENDEDEGEREGEDGEKVPLLFVDVNLGAGKTERIIVYEGDKSEELADKFAKEHILDLDGGMKERLKELLDSQIAGLLSRIDEEVNSHSDTERHNGSSHYHNDQIQEEDDQAEEGSYRKNNRRHQAVNH